MPGLTVACSCGKSLKLPEASRGARFTCPHCHARVRCFTAPASAPPTAPVVPLVLTVREAPAGAGELIIMAGGDALEIGKGEAAGLRLVGPSVSRRHCRIGWADAGWVVEDLGSTNGLFVNDGRVSRRALRAGDAVRIGEFTLVVSLPAAKAGAHPASAKAAAVARAAPGLTLLEGAAASAALATVSGSTAAAGDAIEFVNETVAAPAHRGACPNCAAPAPAEARICVACGTELATGRRLQTDAGDDEAARVRQGPRGSVVAYLKDCLWSFALIFRLGNLIKFFVIAVVTALCAVMAFLPMGGMLFGPLKLFGFSLLAGWIFAYFFNVVESAAGGEEDLPEMGMGDGLWDGFAEPFLKFLGMLLLVHVPVVLYVVTIQAPWTILVDGSDPVVEVLLWLRALLWPIAMLLTAVGGLSCFWRIDLIAISIARSLVPYLTACGMTALALWLADLAAEAAVAHNTLFGGSVVATVCILAIVTVGCWLVAMRCIGLYGHHFKGRFAWSWG